LKRDFDLPWAGTNAHFVLGMLGFMQLIMIRSFFQAGGGLLGTSVAGLTCSGLLLMVSIVNRGVAAGSGDGMRYGATILHLLLHYTKLLARQATKPGSFGPLQVTATVGFVVSAVCAVRAIIERVGEKD
jgi:hypothetical protein